MKLGFTGTREGMAYEQFRSFLHCIRRRPPAEFHFGCCVGADHDAWECVVNDDPKPRVVAHPPTNRAAVAESSLMFADEVRPAADYLTRNRNIVDACDVLLACPKGPEEQRSGTWATIRYARKVGKPVVIFWPDGQTEGEIP